MRLRQKAGITSVSTREPARTVHSSRTAHRTACLRRPRRQPFYHAWMGWTGGPSVPWRCKHCNRETVVLQTAYGGRRLFDAEMFPTADSFAGNRFAIARRSRQVIDLDCVLESRWPARCLHLHKFSCPQSYDDARHGPPPRQPNHIDLQDIWQRVKDHEGGQRSRKNLG